MGWTFVVIVKVLVRMGYEICEGVLSEVVTHVERLTHICPFNVSNKAASAAARHLI